MSGQTEQTFVKAFANILASQPVTFDDDFQEEPAKTLKRVPVLQVCAINRQFLISRMKRDAHSLMSPRLRS
jgi:hypothetical protein